MIDRSKLTEKERRALCQALIWSYEHAIALSELPPHNKNAEHWRRQAKQSHKLYKQVVDQ